MKKRKKRLLGQRIFAVALSVCLLANSVDFTVLAAGTGCNHVHDAYCGYREAVAEQLCNKGGLTVSGGDAGHIHDENCGFVEAVTEQSCNLGGLVSEEGHEHDESCGYVEPNVGTPCKWAAISGGDAAESHAHDEDCGYKAATEGHPCNLHTEHNEACGYKVAVEGHPCNVLGNLHTVHDEDCGYVAAVTALPCRHVHNAACGGLEPVIVLERGREYITNADQIMAYNYMSTTESNRPVNGLPPLDTDILGWYQGIWLQTTFNYDGYQVRYTMPADTVVTRSANFVNSGQYVKLCYTVTAGSDAVINGKLAVHSDIQIGDDDYATIKVIKDSSGSQVLGISMINTNGTITPESKGAQYNLYFRGTSGVTDVSTYWFGHYNSRQANCYNQSTREELVGTDSGFAVSWQDIELAPGESKTYSIIVGVGEAAEPPKWGAMKMFLPSSCYWIWMRSFRIGIQSMWKLISGIR